MKITMNRKAVAALVAVALLGGINVAVIKYYKILFAEENASLSPQESAKTVIDKTKLDISALKDAGGGDKAGDIIAAAEESLKNAQAKYDAGDYPAASENAKAAAISVGKAKVKVSALDKVLKVKNALTSAKTLDKVKNDAGLLMSAEISLIEAQTAFDNENYAEAEKVAVRAGNETNTALGQEYIKGLDTEAKAEIAAVPAAAPAAPVAEAAPAAAAAPAAVPAAEKPVEAPAAPAAVAAETPAAPAEAVAPAPAVEEKKEAAAPAPAVEEKKEEAAAAPAAEETKEAAAPVVTEKKEKPAPAEEKKFAPAVDESGLPTEHQVAKGECLWVIAGYEKIYNTPWQWPIIYHANTDKISDPNLIFPKQIFKIPRGVSEQEKKDAYKEACAAVYPLDGKIRRQQPVKASQSTPSVQPAAPVTPKAADDTSESKFNWRNWGVILIGAGIVILVVVIIVTVMKKRGAVPARAKI